MTKNKPEFLYGAREIATGKLVSNITNPRRKYWDKKGNAENAINSWNRYKRHLDNEPGQVELVKFQLIEVEEETT